MFYTSRLNATQLNNLMVSYITGNLNHIVDGLIEVKDIKNNLKVITDYKKISKAETAIYIFQAMSDAKNIRQRKNLAYINDVIEQFEQKNPGNCTVLLPLMQSRLWKKHCLLVEVTIKKGEKKIKIHDSQSRWRNIFYPNCLKNLKGYQVEYTSYAKQKDNYSCVYFVYQFIEKILGNKGKEPIKNILRKSQYDALNTFDKKEEDPMGKLIYNNFSKKYSNVRKIESGETIPWMQDTLKSYVVKDNVQKLTDKIIAMDDEDKLEDFAENIKDRKPIEICKNRTTPNQFWQNAVSPTSREVAQNLTYEK